MSWQNHNTVSAALSSPLPGWIAVFCVSASCVVSTFHPRRAHTRYRSQSCLCLLTIALPNYCDSGNPLPASFLHCIQAKTAPDYSSPQAARVLMVAFWLSPYTAGALEESSLPEHRHFAPKTIRGTAVLADAFHVSFNMRKA